MASSVLPSESPGRLRAALGGLALVALALAAVRLAGRYLNSPTVPRPIDFLQVWSAGRLHLAGENPYDPARMYDLQRANRLPDDRASMMWNPPWALALVVPLGALPVNAAQVVWLAGLLALVVASALVLWHLAGGSRERRWVPVVAALAFAPTWFLLVGGQIVGLMLFGVVGFLLASRANRPLLAGACVALTAVKPHLFVPLAVGLLIDATRSPSGRRVVLGGLLALGFASILATIPNPGVWEQYLAGTTGAGSEQHKSLTDWVNPTVGAWVRAQLPGRPFWVQWVPTVLAAAGFGAYWWRGGAPGKWSVAMPLVIPLGLLTAPYGSWMCDQVLLLVALVPVLAWWEAAPGASRRVRPAVAVYALANVAALALMVRATSQEHYVWFAPVIVGCLAWTAHRLAEPCETPSPVGA